MADKYDEEHFFQKFYSDRENNRVIIENIKYALEELEMGTFDLTVSFLLIKDANAGSSRCFTDANIEVENIIEESSGMTLLLPTASLFLDGYSVLQTFLESLETEMTPAMPGDVMERQALRELLQFILSDHSILADNRGKKERESTLAVRFAQHLMVPLVPQKTYVIDSYPHLQQCCRIDHPINGKKGDTSFGIAEGWHGKVDILLMDKEVPCCVEESTKDFEVSSEYSNSSVEGKSNDKFTANNLEQLMAQTVVFSFLQYKENGGKLKTSLVPGIGIYSDKLIIHLYDSVEDVLLETHPIDLFEEDKSKLNLQAILVLWMTLNYRLFCSGIPEAFKKYKAKFHEILTPAQLEKYRSSVISPLHVSEALSHTTKEQNKRDRSGIKPLSDEETLKMRTTEGQKERDGSEIESPADKGQSSQMKDSVPQEQDDNIADRIREKLDNADREIVFNFRNVSSESKSS